MLQTGVTSKENYNFLKSIMNRDEDAMHNYVKQTSSKHFIGKVLVDFFSELIERKITPEDINLAMALSDSKVLIWAELCDNDEAMEDALLLIEDKINAKYYGYGFSINVTTVEKSDHLTPPANFNFIGK